VPTGHWAVLDVKSMLLVELACFSIRFLPVARLLRFDWLSLLMHGQVAVAHIAV